MHTTMLTLLLVVGAGEPTTVYPQETTTAAPCSSAVGCNDCYGGCTTSHACAECGFIPCCCGPMPQTCYAPRFGCYPGNNRHMHRYPAFHGYYYRNPYNYRHLFDYPWHAAPHEPMGFYTYQHTECPADQVADPFHAEDAPAEPLQPVPDAP